jgi:hypothetical protein
MFGCYGRGYEWLSELSPVGLHADRRLKRVLYACAVIGSGSALAEPALRHPRVLRPLQSQLLHHVRTQKRKNGVTRVPLRSRCLLRRRCSLFRALGVALHLRILQCHGKGGAIRGKLWHCGKYCGLSPKRRVQLALFTRLLPHALSHS